jgi:hypothetical protein
MDTDISLKNMLQHENIEQISKEFAIPVLVQAYEELSDLVNKLVTLRMDEAARLSQDKWLFIKQKGVYSSRGLYKFLFSGLVVSSVFKKLWKSRCLNKQKVFAWLLLVDRLNTRDMMDRRHWHVASGLDCAICGREKETREHLFFNCQFASRVWNKVGVSWVSDSSMTTMFERSRNSFGSPKFMEIVVRALWGIWKCRNKKIFEAKQPTFQAWKAVFCYDMELIIHRIKISHRPALLAWLDNL